MTVRLQDGPRIWRGSQDAEGYRTYRVTSKVLCDKTDGPANAMNCPGLFIPGQFYAIDGDSDDYAWCRWDIECNPDAENEPNRGFEITQLFSSKPPDWQYCRNTQPGSPLMEPMRISGAGAKYTEEATHDRFGRAIMTSSFEQIRGQQVEFDKNRPTVKIEMNVPTFDVVSLAYAMQDMVNDQPLWGLPKRCVKLSDINWDRKFYGACFCYFVLSLGFDCRRDTFDRLLLDEGTKALNGEYNPVTGEWRLLPINNLGDMPDRFNPAHYNRYKDRSGENTRVILNGAGVPAGATIDVLNPRTDTTCCPGVPDSLIATLDNVTPGVGCGCIPRILTFTKVSPTLWITSTQNFCNSTFPYSLRLGCIGGTSCSDFTLGLYKHVNLKDQNPVLSLDSTFVPLGCNCEPLSLNFHAEFGNQGIDGCSADIHIQGSPPVTGGGQIAVEKYDEANFLLLGVPLDFTCTV